MANLIRTAKSGSDWTENELLAYNISIVIRSEKEFFGTTLENVEISLDKDVVEFEYPGDEDSLPKQSRKLLEYLDIASKSIEETSVDLFATSLLSSMDYDSLGRVLMNRHNIPLTISGVRSNAQTDVCIMRKRDQILLLLQEDKRLETTKDPKPQVIAEAIAAFQENNRIREDSGYEGIDKMVFPCITMIGTFPMFYLVPVTKELSDCVITGQYPQNSTMVSKHTPKVPRRTSDGMKPVENRKKILQCFEAFKKFVDELEECLKVE